MEKTAKIGVIGLGSMGKPMALNLVKAGYDVSVYDIRTEVLEELKTLGAYGAKSIKEIGEKADIVLVMVLNFQQVSACTIDENGVLSTMKPGSTLIVTSTIAPSEIKKIADIAFSKGIRVLDSPVSGGSHGAEAGSLVLMVSGNDETYNDCKDVLFTVGSNTIKVGTKIGEGQIIKAANQLLVSVHLVAIGEAIVMATKAGANPEILYEVIRKSVGTCPMFEKKMPLILDGDFERRGALDIHIKDLDICLQTGKEVNVPLFAASISKEVFIMANAQGLGREDNCAVVKLYENAAGIQVRKNSKRNSS